MAENELPVPKSPVKPDWIASVMAGKLTDIDNEGIAAEDFDLKNPDHYWGKSKVKEVFTDDKGVERRDLFDNFYSYQQDRYNKSRLSQVMMRNFLAQPFTKLNEKIKVSSPKIDAFETKADPWGRDFEFDTYSAPKYSLRENAIDRGVQIAPGKYTTPDDFSGITRFAKNEDGSYKFDDSGRPFLEPLKEGERLRSFDEAYNTLSDISGSYGYDYDIGKTLMSLPKNAINAFIDYSSALLNYPKSLYGAITNEDATGITKLQNSLKSNRIATPETATNDFWHLGNIADLGQQVIYQLGSMYAVGGAARALGASEKTASIAGRLFMAGITAGPIADMAQDNNLSQRETAILLYGSTVPMYWVSKLDDWVLKGKNPSIQEGLRKVLRDSYDTTFTSGKIEAGGLRSYMTKVAAGTGKLLSSISRAESLPQTAAIESVEEVLEQLVDLGSRKLYNVYNENVDADNETSKFLGTTKGTAFNINAEDELAYIGQSAAGGAIGGSVAHGVLRGLRLKMPKTIDGLEQMVADGKEKEIYQFISKMEREGRIDISWLKEDGSKAIDDDPSTPNARNAKVLKSIVDYMVEVRNQSKLNEVIPNNIQRAGVLKAALDKSNVAIDAKNFAFRIDELNKQLVDAKAGNASSEDINALTEELKATTAALSSIRNGDFVNKYVTQGLYNMGLIANPNQSHLLTGRDFVALNDEIVESQELVEEQAKETKAAINERDKTATIDDYSGISETGRTRLTAELSEDKATKLEALSKIEDKLTTIDPSFSIETLASEDVNEAYEEATMVEPLTANLDENDATLLREAIDSIKKMHALSNHKVVSEPADIEAHNQMLNFVEFVPSTDRFGRQTLIPRHSNIPLAQKLQDELTEETNSNVNNVSLYSASDRITNLLKAIKARREQLKGNREISNILQNQPQDKVFPLIPIIPEQETILNAFLDKYEEEANRLLAKSQENDSNSEVKVKKALLARYETRIKTLEDLSGAFSRSANHSKISDIIIENIDDLHKAYNESNTAAINHTLRKIEQEMYDFGASRKEDILAEVATFSENKFNEASLESEEALMLTRMYDYIRGVTSYSSNDLWNALHSVVSSYPETTISSTPEQDLIAIEAVRNMLGGKYEFPFSLRASGDVILSYSTLIDGSSGTGKTSVIIPLTAGIMNKITGGKIAFASYNNIKTNFTNIPVKVTGEDIISILSNAKNQDVNLIIYDEATLLSREDLREIQNKLQAVNIQRARDNQRPVYILYVADTYQNNAEDPSAPGRVLSVSNKRTIIVPRTERLTFSFRSQNMPLKLAEEHFRLSQTTPHKPSSFEYKGFSGFRIVNSKNDLQKVAARLIDHLKTKDQLSNAVYITNQELTPVSGIAASGISVMTSREAQGREWDYVIVDDIDGNPYKNENTIKSYYTSVTRAKKFAVAFVSPETRLSSKEGTVTEVKPLSPESTSKEQKIGYIREVLGEDYTEDAFSRVRVVENDSELFEDNLEEAKETLEEPPVQESPVSVETPPIDNTQQTTPTNNQMAVTMSSSQEKSTTLYTFYTTGDSPQAIDVNIGLKRSIMFDDASRQRASFFLTIARIGSPEYENVFRNNPDLKGNYALFVEASLDGDKGIIGVLSAKDFPSDLLANLVPTGQEKISIALDPETISSAVHKAPYKVNAVASGNISSIKSLPDIIAEAAPGVSFSSPLVVMRKPEDSPGKAVGDTVVMTSYRYSKAEMEQLISEGRTDEFMTPISLRGKRDLTLKNIVDLLTPLFTVNDKGLFSLKGDDQTWNLYNSLWGHNARNKKSDSGDILPSQLEKSIAQIISQSNNDEYVAFLKEQKPLYILSNYIERKLRYKGTSYVTPKLSKEVAFYEKFFEDLKNTPGFTSGLRFDTRAAKRSALSQFYAFSAELPDSDLYNKMLEGDIAYVESPRMIIRRDKIVSALRRNQEEFTPVPVSTNTNQVVDNIPFNDQDESTNDEEDDSLSIDSSKSISDFAEAEFPGAKGKWLLPAITRFRRRIFDSLYVLTGTPAMNSVQTAMVKARTSFSNAPKPPEGELDDSMMDLYIDSVLDRQFDFLLSKYFPAISYDPSVEQYIQKSDYVKNRGFYDKDSQSLLDEGMTAIVKSYIYSTPIVESDIEGRLSLTNRFLSESDIPELINKVRNALSIQELRVLPKGTDSDVFLSFYVRFLSPAPVTVGGVSTYSISYFQEGTPEQALEATSILNATIGFLKSGAIYHPGIMDTAKGLNAPLSMFIPNNAKEIGLKAINQTLKSRGVVRISSGNVSIGGENYSTVNQYNTDSAIEALQRIGLLSFNKSHFDYLVRHKTFGVDRYGDLEATERITANGLIHDVVIPTALKVSRSEQVTIDGPLDAVLSSIAKVDGIKNTLSDIVNGKKLYRLRNGAPFFKADHQISTLSEAPITINKRNLIVTGRFTIRPEGSFIKQGVRVADENGDRNKATQELRTDEIVETDILYGFADMVDKHNSAHFPIITYSDSTTEPSYMFNSSKGWFIDPDSIASELFDSRAAYHNNLKNLILTKYRDLGYPASSLGELNKIISSVPVSTIASFPGMVAEIHYTSNSSGNASIAPELIGDSEKYLTPGNKANFIKEMKQEYEAFEEFLKTTKSPSGSIWTKLENSKREPAKYAKAFFYNQATIASEMRSILLGSIYQYKGANESARYINMTKRAKALTSTRTSQLFRDENWDEKYRLFKNSNPGKPLPENLRLEGFKLSRTPKIAFVTDVEVPVTLPSGENTSQEVYDGATFVTPLTRIFQKYSNGNNYGVFVGPVMKNITTSHDDVQGTMSFVKNAEFELTPEILRNIGDVGLNIINASLSEPFTKIVAVGGKQVSTPLEALYALGMKEDYSNAEYSHFEALADFLVDNNQQDIPILEIIPITSAKTGATAISDINASTYTSSLVDWTNKGTQLDAMKDVEEGGDTKVVNQLVNAVSINWTDDASLKRLYGALANIAETFNTQISDLPHKQFNDILKTRIREAIETRDSTSYRSRLVKQPNYSLQDRSILNTVLPTMNANFSREAISFKMQGGQYVLHPSNGLIKVYDVQTEEGTIVTVLKSQLNGRTPMNPNGRDLKFIPPAKTESVEDAATIYTPGYAEVLLPAEMKSDFMLQDAIDNNLSIDQITPEYFIEQINKREATKGKKVKSKDRAIIREAATTFESFNKRLSGLMVRIPTTGPHSAMIIRVVGFMNGSMNSVFVPAEFHKIQGSDQDIDKGSYLTFASLKVYHVQDSKVANSPIKKTFDPKSFPSSYKVVKTEPLGIIPFTDENYQLTPDVEEKLKGFTKTEKEKARRIALENSVTQLLIDMVSNEANESINYMPVDQTLEEPRRLRDSALKDAEQFKADSYLSYAKIHELNQAGGRSITGILATGYKGYLVLNIYNKLGNEVPGLSDKDTWKRFSGFINASVDNAKEGILGPMGVTSETAPFVNYLISYGWDEQQIYSFLKDNKAYFDKLAYYKRYDNSEVFNPERDDLWRLNPDLVNLYYRVNEMNALARASLNRVLPSSMYDSFKFRAGIERSVQSSFYRANKKRVSFNFPKFMLDDDYAKEWINNYEKLLKPVDGLPSGPNGINILKVLRTVPHINAYLKTYAIATSKIDEYPIIRMINSTAKSLRRIRVTPFVYNDITDFTYGLVIDQYLRNRDLSIYTDHDLSTPQGRQWFVSDFNDDFPLLQSEFSDNGLISKMIISTDERLGQTSSRVRLPDLMNMTDETVWGLSAEMQRLPEDVRQQFFIYNLITTRDSSGRGSLSPLFSVKDKEDFNNFIDNELVEDGRDLSKVYSNYFKNQKADFGHIPYVSVEKSVQMTDNKITENPSTGIAIPKEYNNLIKDLTELEYSSIAPPSTQYVFEAILDIQGEIVPLIDLLRNASKKRISGMTSQQWIQASKLMKEYERIKGKTSSTETREKGKECRIKLTSV